MINQVVHHVALENTMISKAKLPNLVADHVVLGNTMVSKDKQIVNHVVLGNTTINKEKRLDQLLVNVAMWENTKMKREKHRAAMIALVQW